MRRTPSRVRRVSPARYSSNSGAASKNSSIAVIDFRYSNPGNVPFWVRTVSLIMEDKDGGKYEGKVVSEGDAKRIKQGLTASSN